MALGRDEDWSNHSQKYCQRKTKKEYYKKWNLMENLLYLQFLESNFNLTSDIVDLVNKPKRFFITMSEFMGGIRTNEQCRSHHRKMLKVHLTLQGIIANVRERGKQTQTSNHSTENSLLRQDIELFPLEHAEPFPEKQEKYEFQQVGDETPNQLNYIDSLFLEERMLPDLMF